MNSNMKDIHDNTILIVDDTPENIDILVDLLEDFNNKVAINGRDALETAWEEDAPDLILLDIMMPEMDGYEVCEKLRANDKTKEVPVIFLTAKTQQEDIVRGFEVGGQDYITKPFDSRELMERVKTQLELKHQREVLKNMNNILEEKVKERTAQVVEANNNLEIANNKLLVLDKAKNNFLNLISHEIRTPLNGIVGSTFFLEDMIEDPELKEFVGMLKESVDRLDRFSQTALEITQIQTRGSEMKKSELRLNAIINELIETLLDKSEAKGVKVLTKLVERDKVIGVENALKKSFKEIICNAIKFSDDNETVEIVSTIEENRLIFSITDKGQFIPPEKIEDITTPFGLANDHYDQNTGLGLSFVKSVLEIHDAEMKIESTEEKTTFILYFDI
ncbi:MAG: hypothetical protein C0598_07955 [Marinilabiliales bacterium]|nr:MAG: hypothetical protein C0598_07955 [Marinilabiliales bacterium]